MEDSFGVTRLVLKGHEVGVCVGEAIEKKRVSEIDGETFCWLTWEIEALNLSHRSALLFLHGATLQQLFEPVVLLKGSNRPVENPTPGLDLVLLAASDREVLPEVLRDRPLQDLFSFFHSCLRA